MKHLHREQILVAPLIHCDHTLEQSEHINHVPYCRYNWVGRYGGPRDQGPGTRVNLDFYILILASSPA